MGRNCFALLLDGRVRTGILAFCGHQMMELSDGFGSMHLSHEKAFFVLVISASIVGDWLESGRMSVGLVNHY